VQKIKQFLERRPFLYRIVLKIYLPFALGYIHFRKYLNRNKLPELWAKGYYHKGNETAKQYRETIEHPHRSFLISKLANSSPIYSILEIGCSTGPNLYLFAKEFPNAEIRGVDIDPQVVKMGNDWFAREGISNVKLSVGRAEELGEFEDKSFDVMLTDAVLIYVSRGKIYGVIKNMVRIARKRLIFVEWHDFAGRPNERQGLGVYTNGHWVRDYVALLKQFVPEEQIRVTNITEDIWPGGGGWKRYGALIEVIIS